MSVVLSEAGEATVNGAAIDASGWVILLGGLLLTAFWIYLLVR